MCLAQKVPSSSCLFTNHTAEHIATTQTTIWLVNKSPVQTYQRLFSIPCATSCMVLLAIK